jgi:putative intracellular protease/amidase
MNWNHRFGSPAALVAALMALSLAVITHAAAAVTPAKKVLLVVSSEGRDNGKTRPGFEMDEYAQAYLVLRANGIGVDVASPAGGAVEADRFKAEDDHIRALFAIDEATQLLKSTRRIADVKPGEHSAIYLIGGKGAMFDLPKSDALAELLSAHYRNGGIIAAVCHGPAALARVTRPDGQPLVKGLRVTGFTDEEEAVFGKKWVKEFPFLIETRFRELGAVWEEAPLMMPKVVVDRRVITGQNPFSTAQATDALVTALGRAPAPRAIYSEERSMKLLERWIAGERDAVKAILAADAKHYRTDLIGVLGYYQWNAAKLRSAKETSLSIMELAAPYMKEPELKLAIAKAHSDLGNIARARAVLTNLVAEQPDFADAKKALAALPG